MVDAWRWGLTSFGLLVWVSGCKEEPPSTDGGSGESGIVLTAADESGPILDVGNADTGTINCGEGVGQCDDQVDLLFVIDNSGSMGEEQLNLALNMPKLVRGLEELTDAMGNPVAANVHIMVTTTDSGNPLCDPYYKPGRSPEEGTPISSACTDRLDRFTSVSMPPVDAEGACTTVCPTPLAPEGDFISFNGSLDNVPDVAPADVDGDGMDDSPAAQTLSCVGPQGIDGCGYESPLDSMLQALDPGAPWNQGSDPFLRTGSLLAVAIITDEADCSIVDESVMADAAFQEDHPETGMAQPTSAICWNAGVSCDGPDGNGLYGNCESTGDRLRPVQEYVDFLQDQNRRVVMLGIVGIPPVTARNPDPPYQPTAGGLFDLEYRDWRDPDYANGGDILPDDWNNMIDASFKQYQFGIGPGCTGEDGMGGFTGQAIPPVRIKEVCQALDVEDDPATNEDESDIRCCMESICDTDFSPALRCLAGLIQENVIPVE
ncbi:hypothetical protein [Paraliomyxa miuraensis]|uniref:hypothetical protein n=1 Tax=Paraliomyxa miuraensis TaxID=376150 RepID=UPI002250F1DD|nr:hypothetical protein [Paraliomyxa miuraensis]MCX4241511.1 hypothetical protein [Paraliomyxa miuraensis]